MGQRADFNLNRNDHTTGNLLDKLQQLKTPVKIDKTFCKADKDGNYYVQDYDNYTPVQIEITLRGFADIADDLRYTGQLIPNKISKIEVYYKGVDQNFTIPVVMA